jgi:hypothetical protein
MKRGWLAAPAFALLILSMHAGILAQSSNLLMLSKTANGPILDSGFSLTLLSNPDCDRTQGLIPDGSRMVADAFALKTDSFGVGTFSGFAKILAQDGRLILQGYLRGAAGINTRCDANKDCRVPGRMTGLFEGLPAMSARSVSRSPIEIESHVLMINFSAELNDQAASPLAVYRVRLDGLVSAPSAIMEKIQIAPDRPVYAPADAIMTSIFNGSDRTIQSLGNKSFCTIVQLQIQDGIRWSDVAVCASTNSPDAVTILPNQRIEVPLRPASQTPAPNPPGIYRLAFSFRVVENGVPVGDSVSATSDPFLVAAPPSSDRVSIVTERSEFDVSEPIVFKVHNGNDQVIVTSDHKSSCSIVYLQKQQPGGWANLAPCLLLTPTRLIPIGARQSLSMRLPPDGTKLQFPAGTYRLEMTYQFAGSGGQPVGDEVTVHSPQFTLIAR